MQQQSQVPARRQTEQANKRRGCLGVVVFVLVLVIIIVVLVATCHGAADDPALASAAQSALAADATFAPLVDSVTAKDDGTVIVTLNQTSAALAGSSNGAEKVGAAVNALVLDAILLHEVLAPCPEFRRIERPGRAVRLIVVLAVAAALARLCPDHSGDFAGIFAPQH